MSRRDDEVWLRRARGCAAHFAKYRAYPKGYGLGDWLGAQRSAARLGLSWLTPERTAVLDALLPGWRESANPAPPSWEQSALAVLGFWQEHRRWPSQVGTSRPGEQSLGRWLSVQRVAANKNKLSRARRTWLDQNAPGWNPIGTRDDAWHLRAHQLGEWCNEHDRLPVLSSDQGPEATTERQLAHWLKNRRMEHRAGMLSPERAQLLRELLRERWKP